MSGFSDEQVQRFHKRMAIPELKGSNVVISEEDLKALLARLKAIELHAEFANDMDPSLERTITWYLYLKSAGREEGK